MTGLPFTWSDGGREEAGFRGETGDCVTRAIAIATGVHYSDVYSDLWERIRASRRDHKGGPRTGVHRWIYEPYLADLGWAWTPTMRIGEGCRVHLRPGELPGGRLIARLSKHVTAVVDGHVFDTHDPCRGGTRCVYGYYAKT